MLDAPAAARVELVARALVTTGPTETPAFPAQWFYGLLRDLPGDRAFLPPSPPGSLPRRLDASVGASGPHDFAVRVGAVRQERLRVHRIPCPTFVTMANAPLMGTGRSPYAGDLREKKSGKFLREGLDR